MGGSSLCPEVLADDLRHDRRASRSCTSSTRPTRRRSRRSRARVDLDAHAVHRVEQVGQHARAEHLQAVLLRARRSERSAREEAGSRFIAITDPGSKLQQVAESDGFRHVFFGVPSIGGRYSALSDFGLVPAAVDGRRRRRRSSIAPRRWCTPACRRRPGRREPRRRARASILGVAANARPRQGHAHRLARHRATSAPGSSSCSPSRPARRARASSRSTARRSAPPDVYGNDRLFVYLRLASAPDAAQDASGRRARARPASRSCASTLDDAVRPRRRSSSAGRSRPPSPARSSASTRSTSPTSKRARSRRAS